MKLSREEVLALLSALNTLTGNGERDTRKVEQPQPEQEETAFVMKQVSSNTWIVAIEGHGVSKEVARFEPVLDEIDTPKHRAQVVLAALQQLEGKALATAGRA